MSQQYVQYSDSLEVVADSEKATHERIVQVMEDGMSNVKHSHNSPHNVRISHAKAHAILVGRLTVDPSLPPELAQGLFAQPSATHPVIVRLSAAPGESTDDSKLQTARGMSVKVFNVTDRGPHLAPFDSITTQDFVLDTGKEFFNSNAESFLQTFKPNAKVAPSLSDSVKGAVSSVAAGLNSALNAVGMNSEKLDFFGHGRKHPMDEEYYSQIPLRYGQYVCKLAVKPSPNDAALQAVRGAPYEPATYDAFRDSSNQVASQAGGEGLVFDVLVQLCTTPQAMPIEDAMAKWSEEESPYRHVARIVLPRQTAYDTSKDAAVEKLSFSPSHTLEAHRPLGSIGRARLVAYNALAAKRRGENGWQQDEPTAPPAALSATGESSSAPSTAAAGAPVVSGASSAVGTVIHTVQIA